MTKIPQVELRDVSELVPYEKNAKKHSEAQVGKLVKLILKVGWTQPIITDGDMVIIAGHGRRLAALEIARQTGVSKIPVVVRSDLTKEEADALRLADNRVTSTEYDMGMIEEELRRLAAADFDIDIIGFDAAEIEFTTADLAAFDESAFVEDVSSAVESQQEGNKAAAEKVDETAAPVVDALGFKRITIAESRQLRDLVGRMETRTGKQGIAALLEHLGATV
ncbi:ParB/Srx family N-terminal domain-containing protein [Aureimonas sp. AU40]|uniref:ParB/Srx family N-terminal domain-containing protein n=1 Tax=Aureimonas sp. AU40 TaxID=1637747 RepID=UPI000780614B|nr:ParB/Srx family N-terminal domain-containing protein [Aureimonas sp. AU40]